MGKIVTIEVGGVVKPSGSLEVSADRSAESWQFFAFVFAALVTLALALIDEMPDRLSVWRIAAKLVAFFAIGYITLISRKGRNALVRLLIRFKVDGRLP